MADITHYGDTSVAGASEPFVLFKENHFAFAAVHRLSTARLREVCALVYLHGDPGVGKTHLAQQFIGVAQRQNPALRTVYLTAEDFAAGRPRPPTWEPKDLLQPDFAGADRLVFEGLHKIDGQRDLQHKLVALQDQILQFQGRCLITSRKPLGEFRSLLPRLFNRCQAGICADIQLPGIASRSELVRHFAQRQQIPLPAKVVEFLVRALPVSPRDLRAAVSRLDKQARLERRSIDLDFARRSLERPSKSGTVTLRRITQAVARQFGMPVADVRAQRRQREQLLPRQCAMLLARELTEQSLRNIASYFGRRSHKSVLYACRRLNESQSHDPQLRRHLAQIRRALDPSHTDSR